MRLIAEERSQGTLELLLTSPVRDWELTIGKWLGAFALYLMLLAITLVVRVVELKQQVRLHLPACTPDQAIFAQVLGRLPRLIC